MDNVVRTLVDRQQTKIHVRNGEGRRCCAQPLTERLVQGRMHETRSGHCQGRNRGRHQNFLGRAIPRDLHMSAHCDGHDPGTADARLKIKAGSGHRSPEGIACTRPKRDSSRLKARCSASGQPSSKKTDAMGEPGGQPRRNLPQRRNAGLSKRRAGGDEMRNSDPQEMLGST